MSSLSVKSKYRGGNWIINLSVLLCNLNIIISQSCDSNNVTESDFPLDWPCLWNNGVIPFVFDYFSMSPKRLNNLIRKGHEYIEARSCLIFEEHNPVVAAHRKNFTYLFYTYSEVLESCCLQFYTKNTGRRLVLITPVCSLPKEVGHATLHGLGLHHTKHGTFSESNAKAVIYINQCRKQESLNDFV